MMNDEEAACKTKQRHQSEEDQNGYNYRYKLQGTTTHDAYRQVLSTANKLEAIQSKLDSVIDLFGTPVITDLLFKLCNECLNLLLKCEFKLVEFRKAEDLVWRRVYHDIYRLLKTKGQLSRKDDEFLIESHFMSGICFYSTLIVQLRLRFTITSVQNVLNPLNLALVPVDGLLDSFKQSNVQVGNSVSAAARQWARQSIYRSLIYMGDIARYLLEFSDCDLRSLAYELYKSAARYQPDYGLPFNQLATLAGGLNYNLDAVCNYMRCCLRPKPFERAEGNMVKIFEFNKKQHNDLRIGSCVMKVADVIASKEPAKEAESLVRATIVTFLKLSSELWFAMGDDLSDEVQNNVVAETQRFFEILREAIELDPIIPLAGTDCIDMEFRPTSGGPYSLDKACYLSPTIMYEFCSISIMLIARRKRQSTPDDISGVLVSTGSSINNNISDLVNTLALNLLHYATLKCQKMIISKMREIRLASEETFISTNPMTKLVNVPEISSDIKEGADSEKNDLINLDSDSDDGALIKSSCSLELSSRSKLRPTRSNHYENNKDSKFVMNETYTSLTAPDLLTGDSAHLSYKTNSSLYHDDSGTPSELGSEQIANSAQSTIESTLAYVYNQTYLPSMKVFFDWLLSDVAIIDYNLKSFTSYHKELINTVNLLNELKRIIELDEHEMDSEIYRHTFSGSEWIQRYPMSCDLPFINLGPVKNVHDANINFGIQYELTDAESGFVTMECVVGFSHALTSFLKNKAL